MQESDVPIGGRFHIHHLYNFYVCTYAWEERGGEGSRGGEGREGRDERRVGEGEEKGVVGED